MKDQDAATPIKRLTDHRALMALVDASRVINDDLCVPDMFRRIAEQAAAVLQAEGASVLLLSSSGEELEFTVATGPAGATLAGHRMPADQGIAGQTVRTRRAVRVDNVEKNRNFFPQIDAKTNLNTRSILAAPLLHHDQVLGVVEVINPLKGGMFTDDDLELLKVFANLAAAATDAAQFVRRIDRENQGLRSHARPFEVIGQSPALAETLKMCEKVAGARTTVLITGETGSGKEMAARAVHHHSPRVDCPFIAVNCAALPENLMESELFGHEKGAFTGASDRKLGRFELADEGTLFLDEVGELSAAAQTKLLRVLQEKEFNRVGGTETIHCDVRIIAATNRELKAEVAAGRFREDLFYRLNIFPIQMPPLRDRLDDVPLLIEHFTQLLAPDLGVDPPKIDPDAMAAMVAYHWPGNVRELRNVVERCILLAEGDIELADLPREIASPELVPMTTANVVTAASESPATPTAAGPFDSAMPEGGPVQSRLAEQERALLIDALQRCGWNQSAAARDLGVTRDHLRYRIKKYGLKKK